MKYFKYALLVAVVTAVCFCGPARAEFVTTDEALQIARNWITEIAYYTGDWAGSTAAEVSSTEEFRSDDRLLGYYFTIEPGGFIIVSLVKGLAPVKVYSTTSRLDPDADDGPAALFKFQLQRLIRELELQVGPVSEITPEEVEEVLVYKHLSQLQMLTLSSDDFLREMTKDDSKRDYIEEEIMLTSHWHQFSPYNLQVPAASADCSEDNCAVGCVATAAAQIMRYWSWPPDRGFDWSLMPDYADGSSTLETSNAVAELCSAIGTAVGMDYCSNGCESSVPTADMIPVYDDWHYVECSLAFRDETSQATWWQLAKAHLSVNEPIQYRIELHSIVLDGWREWYHGEYIPEYHMNYGWDNDYNNWYRIDQLHQVSAGANWEQEYMLVGIVPGMSLHSSVTGPVIKWPFNYRYVNRDCTAHAANFDPGQFIQFLPGVALVCVEESMRFTGSEREQTYLYTPEPDRGIRIDNGAMVFYPGCGIRFQQSRPGP